MIEAIKEIGEYALEKEDKDINNPLDMSSVLIGDPESNLKNPSYKNILLILIQTTEGNYEYKGIDIEEYSRDKIEKYLYKRGNSNYTDITPTSRITTIESTFNKKILSWFEEYNSIGLDENTIFLVKIGECIRKNEEKILENLTAKHESINGSINKKKKKKAILTLKINDKYIGDYEIFRKILFEKSKKRFYSKYKKISKAENELCYVCNKKQNDIYGFVDTYQFYTVDKPGFVSGGFQQKDAWKVYPVCLNCALTLEAGKKYLKDKLNFYFYGFNYHILPKYINKETYESKKNFFDLIENWHDPNFTKKEVRRLTQDEKEILDLMSEQNNYINLNFMFYEAPKGYDGSVFKILLYIEDVLPSRLKKLFDLKKEIDEVDIFKECTVPVFENKEKIGEKQLDFNFGIVRTFFPKISDKRNYDKYFLELTNKIFTGKQVDYDFMLHFIMQKIRDEFVNDYSTKISTLKGFMLLNYLNKLSILKTNKKNINKPKMEPISINMSKEDTTGEIKDFKQKTDSFFEQFVDFFDCDAKKAIFLQGVLTQFLLKFQSQIRGATPFMVKLKGLKLNEKQVKKLLPEVQNKLEEYGKNCYRPLESIISGYFISAGSGWKLTNDEISFCFVLGMNLSYIFELGSYS